MMHPVCKLRTILQISGKATRYLVEVVIIIDIIEHDISLLTAYRWSYQ